MSVVEMIRLSWAQRRQCLRLRIVNEEVCVRRRGGSEVLVGVTVAIREGGMERFLEVDNYYDGYSKLDT